MKIPKKIKIFGHTIDIIYDSRSRNGADDFGTFDCETNKLRIRSDVPQSIQESTLIHEILEALNDMIDLKLDHKQICALEVGLYSTFKNNNLLK